MKLNIGCGGQIVDGWVNLDLEPSVPGAEQGDIRTLDYDEATFAVIAAHHVLDLLPTWTDLVDALAECRRVVTEDGVMRVSLADPRKMIEAVESMNSAWFVLDVANHNAIGESAQRWWAQRRLFLVPVLVGRAARSAGWSDVLLAAYKATFAPERLGLDAVMLDARRDESFFVDLIP